MDKEDELKLMVTAIVTPLIHELGKVIRAEGQPEEKIEAVFKMVEEKCRGTVPDEVLNRCLTELRLGVPKLDVVKKK